MSFQEILDTVEGVEPFSSALRGIFEKLGSDKLRVRWEARRNFMIFMLEHGVEFMDRWPQFTPDLKEILDHLWEQGLGRQEYRTNLARLREIVHVHTLVK
jgi:hypothetical protein